MLDAVVQLGPTHTYLCGDAERFMQKVLPYPLTAGCLTREALRPQKDTRPLQALAGGHHKALIHVR